MAPGDLRIVVISRVGDGGGEVLRVRFRSCEQVALANARVGGAAEMSVQIWLQK